MSDYLSPEQAAILSLDQSIRSLIEVQRLVVEELRAVREMLCR